MGSMTKVMQKIQEEGAPARLGPPDAEVAPGAPPPEEVFPGPPSEFVADAGPTGDASASPGPASAGTEPQVHGEITAWDTQRVDPAVVAFHDRYSGSVEQYRASRARLLTMNTGRAAQVLAITSAIPEEGKSVSTLNLGLVMAEGGEHRILVVDADFRRTSLARMLGVPEGPGLAEVLRGEVRLSEALQSTPLPNLRLLPAGKTRGNSYGELLGGPTLTALLGELRASYDYTFVDTPPVTTVSDVCLLAPHCDGALVVIQMRRTPEPTVQQAVRTLQANNVKIIGAILSRFRERGASYYDHYYSSYYYR